MSELQILADYHQIYLFDAGTDTILGTDWPEWDTHYASYSHDGLAVGTVEIAHVTVTVLVLEVPPPDDSASFDHVIEASIHVSSGRVALGGPTEDEEGVGQVEVPVGWVRVRVSRSHLDVASEGAGPTNEDFLSTEEIRVQIWPAPRADPVLIKQWQPARRGE